MKKILTDIFETLQNYSNLYPEEAKKIQEN
jgi:hypothetical protein